MTIKCQGDLKFYNKVQNIKQRKECNGYSENIYLKGDYETVVENEV